MSQTAAQRLLRNDSRTAKVAAHTSVALPTGGAEALLRTLRAGETVLALYRQELGYAALTEDALILLGGGSTPQATRVPRPLTILRPADGSRGRADVSVEGRRIRLQGTQFDQSGELIPQTGEPVPDPPADPRIATAAAGESISLSDGDKKVLLEELEPDEAVRSMYHNGWGYAVLTGNGLVLIRNLLTPKATRVPRPLQILRRGYGIFGSVEILVDGKPHKLHGSKLDPKGELLETVGELLPPGSPLRPSRGTRFSTWVRRHPVFMSTVAAGVFFAGLNSGSSREEAVAQNRADQTLAVPDFNGTSLTTAAAEARLHPWQAVSAADASSAYRPVKITEPNWRVCFQHPSRDETVRPSGTTLTLYTVPVQEECPTRLHGPRLVMMPGLVGERLDDASRTLGDLGLDHVDHFHAHTGKHLDDEPQDLADRQVCRQHPEPDAKVSTATQVDLWLIGPSAPCAEPSPTPAPTPKPKPKPKPRPQPSYGSTTGGGATGGSTSGGSSSTAGSTSGGSSGSSGGSPRSRTGAQFGQYCSPVGVTATTADGRPAKCFKGKDGRARWGYNSG
ncbi:PASTA domain-containing protein [Streptomyces sp. NPDC051644]|uniref:PASTA domain-containing protein n=1 Tax=Streptomyces sp. NPDC051644 TaxID=3365666 RepID=UPI003791DB5E